MTAIDFLARLRAEHELLTGLFKHIPGKRAGGGSDVRHIPLTLRLQLAALGGPQHLNAAEAFAWYLERNDWTGPLYREVLGTLPADMRERVTPSERFAVGSRPSGEISAEIVPVPEADGDSFVLVFDAGLFHFISSASRLVAVWYPQDLRQVLVRSSLASAGIEEHLTRRLFREFRTPFSEGWWRGRTLETATTLAELVVCYVTLGVPAVKMPRGFTVLPNYPFIVGHALECSAWATVASLRFVLLHELAHVLLDHARQQDRSIHEKEFEADYFAFRYLAEHEFNRTQSITLSLCGVALLFSLLGFIEQTDKERKVGTHPSARARLSALFKCVHELREVIPSDFAESLLWADTLQKSVNRMWVASGPLRQLMDQTGGPLATLLDHCAQHGSTLPFEDELPRWLVYSAPEKLCREIARISLELDASDGSKHTDTPERLKRKMIDWASQILQESKFGSESLHYWRGALHAQRNRSL